MRWFPGSMTGRIFLILLLGILASIALTFWLAFGEDKVAEVKGRVRQAESQLREVNHHVEEGRSELAQIERRKEALLSSLSEKATEMARRQGLPSTSCIDCAALRMITPIVAAGSRIVEGIHAKPPSEMRLQAPDSQSAGAQDAQACPTLQQGTAAASTAGDQGAKPQERCSERSSMTCPDKQ